MMNRVSFLFNWTLISYLSRSKARPSLQSLQMHLIGRAFLERSVTSCRSRTNAMETMMSNHNPTLLKFKCYFFFNQLLRIARRTFYLNLLDYTQFSMSHETASSANFRVLDLIQFDKSQPNQNLHQIYVHRDLNKRLPQQNRKPFNVSMNELNLKPSKWLLM